MNSEGEKMDAEFKSGASTAVQAADAPNPDHEVVMTVASAKSIRSPAFQFYPRDFLSSSKVDQMSMTERGVYITLLSRCWLDEGLPTEMKDLAGMAKMKVQQFERLWNSGQLGRCFTKRGERYQNARLDRELKAQAEYRQRQSDNGRRGGRPKAVGKPEQTTAFSGLSHGTEVANPLKAPLPLPQSSSSSSSARESGPRPLSPIHTSHRNHAACGRICVVASQHTEFVKRRNHDGADQELRDWYLRIDGDWSDGPHAADEPGDSFRFWEARYSEQWPPSVAAQASAKPAKRWANWTPTA